MGRDITTSPEVSVLLLLLTQPAVNLLDCFFSGANNPLLIHLKPTCAVEQDVYLLNVYPLNSYTTSCQSVLVITVPFFDVGMLFCVYLSYTYAVVLASCHLCI